MKLIAGLLTVFLLTNVQNCFGVDQSICNDGATIDYYPNGQLRTCPLKDDYQINGLVCAQYSPITFYPQGALLSCTSNGSFVYRGITCNDQSVITFYPT